MAVEQNINIQQNLNELANTQCPECRNMTEMTGENLLVQSTEQNQNLVTESTQQNQNLLIQTVEQNQNMVEESSQQNQNLAQNIINAEPICPDCQIS